MLSRLEPVKRAWVSGLFRIVFGPNGTRFGPRPSLPTTSHRLHPVLTLKIQGMRTQNLGYPRIGLNRELKKACEQYWSGKIDQHELLRIGRQIRQEYWQTQLDAGMDLIPCNDFSFYDQVVDMSLLLDAIPARHRALQAKGSLDLSFAMARGYQQDGLDITAMELTKWLDTNYHYLVPEFTASQEFQIASEKVFDEFEEAKAMLGAKAKPVLIGPVSYLLLGKEKEDGFDRVDLIRNLVPVYVEIINRLRLQGARW